MNIVKFEEVAGRVIELRDKKVILDSYVADLYSVKTKEINQGVANNPDKFPKGYVFKLNKKEKKEVVKNFDHLNKIKYSPYLPNAFSEKGLYMLATILKGEKATETTLAIIEAFARLRQLTRNIKELADTKNKDKQQTLMKKSGGLMAGILEDVMEVTDSETTVEINFAVLKLKHTLKKGKKQ